MSDGRVYVSDGRVYVSAGRVYVSAGRGESFFIHQGAAGGAASLPGPSAVLVKLLKTGSCHAE